MDPTVIAAFPDTISFDAGPLANFAAAVIVAAAMMAILKGKLIDMITGITFLLAVFALFTLFSINIVIIIFLLTIVLLLKAAAVLIETYVLDEEGRIGGETGIDKMELARLVNRLLSYRETDDTGRDRPPIEDDDRPKR